MNILKKSETFIFQLFKDRLSNSYSYHNFNHTLRVVAAVKELIAGEKIGDKDAEILLLASWFHDAGYVEGWENHEEKSVVLAQDFLKENGMDQEAIQAVISLIRATKVDAEPQSKLEEIIKDADFHHFADENYISFSGLLREEWKQTRNRESPDLDWAIQNRDMMVQRHRFFTDHAKEHWQPGKEKNIFLLEKNIKKLSEGNGDVKSGKKKKREEKKESPERGIETMFRVTLNNHTRLSGIADTKANILLSVNAIIISIALSSLLPKLDSASNEHLIIPTFVMLMFSVVSIIFAILSTLPNVTSGVFTRKDIEEKKVNLLFFGNFHKMPADEYLWAVNEVMKDREYLYNSLIRDLYYLGLVLNKKYKLLRITYTIFMIGIIVSVITFIWTFKSAGI